MLGTFLGFGVIGIGTRYFVCLLLSTSFGSARSSCDAIGLVRNTQK